MFISMRDEYNNFRFLPNSGGFFQQDWFYMEIFNIIREEFIKGSKK